MWIRVCAGPRVGTLLTMAANDSGKAASTSTTSTKAGTARAEASDPRTETDRAVPAQDQSVENPWQEEQRLAHEAQQKIAQRRPDQDVPDIGKRMGEEGASQLSDWEKQGSAAHGDVTEQSVREELFEQSAMTPAEKAEAARRDKAK